MLSKAWFARLPWSTKFNDTSATVLWESSQGQVIVWAITDSFGVTASPLFGPVAGWTAERLAAGSDGLIRVFWLNVDGSVAI